MVTITSVTKAASFALLGLSLALATTGCREQLRPDGEYSVINDTGAGTCVPNGQTIPDGYKEHPAGETPMYVDEVYP